ncbi:MAG: metallophosphoesterase [Oscillibacter sp.]|nr:metallophosphoesterase [Oscillibacter sp.]
MKLLLLSDKECPAYWDYYQPGRLSEFDLMLSCGDLSARYLSFLVTMARAPLLYVHGNHDGYYETTPPEGCDCVEDRLVTIKGLRILGLGGSAQYSGGPHQYTERQMQRRIRRLWFQLRRAGGVDIVLTHCPPQGYGDDEDYAHRGFACFLPLLERYKPSYLIHGHVHVTYGINRPRVLQYGETTVINAYERYILEIP